MDENYKAGKVSVSWDDVQPGDIVFIDNYEDGKFPRADPKISGPYVVKTVKDRRLETTWNRRYQSTFSYYPNNLLREG